MTAKSNVTIEPLVRVENLVKYYSKKKFVGSGEQVRALDGVSFSIFRGTALAIVGESGSGSQACVFQQLATIHLHDHSLLGAKIPAERFSPRTLTSVPSLRERADSQNKSSLRVGNRV